MRTKGTTMNFGHEIKVPRPRTPKSDAEEDEGSQEEESEEVKCPGARSSFIDSDDWLGDNDPSVWEFTTFCRFLDTHCDYQLLREDVPRRVTPGMLQDDLTAKYWVESWQEIKLRPLAAACVCELRNIMISQARQRQGPLLILDRNDRPQKRACMEN